ncbi:MAG TPA: hypothetical protein VJ455_06430, partial [Ignavibacteria bacterium]|nr:hypothetical protein [Ignavibacteria bacterium]
MKSLKPIFAIVIFLLITTDISSQVMFVKDVSNNADIYFMPNVNNPANIRRLTTHTAIDNHPDYYVKPSPPETLVVWSTNRDGNFEIYISKLTSIYSTLENPNLTRLTTNNYSDRHPHLSHDGLYIVHSANNFTWTVTCPKSRCSIPVPTPCGRYEKLQIIRVSPPQIIPIELVGMSITGGGTWPTIDTTFKGHPSFNPSNNKIIFSAAMDEAGSNWETYTVNITLPNILSNLTRVTQGTSYVQTPNPIQMSAGAHFTEDGNSIIYSSTRTPLGNSQLYKIPSTSVNVPVSPVNQLTWNYGNDYVPEQLSDGRIVLTSDLGPNNICPPPDTGATDDLDIEIINSDGSGRSNLTNNNANNEMLLIGDEVSWFCGLKPNLSPCTFYPKYWNICWWKEFYRLGNEPTYLPNFPNRELYTRAWRIVTDYMYIHNSTYFQSIMQAMSLNWNNCNNGWLDIQSWWIVPSLFGRRDTLQPPNPALVSPQNKANINVSPVLFDWTDVIGDNALAVTYGLQVSTSPGFGTTIINQTGLTLSQFSASIPNGLLYWRASATNPAGTVWSTVWYLTGTVGIKQVGNEIPNKFMLYHNYPNPFNPVTNIRFDIPPPKGDRGRMVRVIIYDLLGREVATLVNEQLNPGTY